VTTWRTTRGGGRLLDGRRRLCLRLRPSRATVRLIAGGAVAALALSACGSGLPSAGSAAPPPDTPIFHTLPTSLATTTGTWASVPMGHLGHPLNTFWQLFFLPATGGRWDDHAGQLGIADNGGLLLASPGQASLVVAIRPSHYLKYSALALTSADGHSWRAVPAIQGDAASLAAGGTAGYLAVVQSASGGRLVRVANGSSTWQTVTTARTLAASPPGKACDPVDLDAVALEPSGTAVVGATCGHRGIAGVFVDGGGTWRTIGPSVASPRDEVSVLALRATGAEPNALFSLSSRSGRRIVDGWQTASGAWVLTDPLDLGPRGQVVSVGAAPNGREFVLFRVGSDDHLALAPDLEGSGTSGNVSWTSLPTPPAGTETVAFSSGGRIDALAVHDTVMTDWVLATGASAWEKRQSVTVTLLFGSST
jgi:hypothetical protein